MTAVRRLLCVLAAGVLAMASAGGVAAAHATLIGTDPADGAALATAPASVSATFSEDLQPTFPAMTVIGPDGARWSTGETSVDGRIATVDLRPLGPAGTYTANYRVTSADGHVISGSWSFEFVVPGTGTSSTAAPSTAPASAPAAAPEETSGPAVWPAAVGVVVAAGAGLWWWNRRRT